MAGSIIKIKRSKANGAPGSLEYGELAYSGKADTQKLFIGMYGDGAQSGTVLVTPIGGKFYTDLLDVTPGTLTASKALIVDSNSKLDRLLVDNLELNENIITTATNTDLSLDANGTGKIVFNNGQQTFSLPKVRGDANQVLTRTGSTGETTWASVAVDLTINADQGSDTSINLLNDTLRIRGLDGIYTVFNNNTLQIFGRQATSSQLGVASFSATDFDVDTSAHVSIKTESIQDIVGKMFTDSVSIANGGTGATQENSNITVSYADGSGRLELDVNTATTTTAGVAQFNADQFVFSTGSDALESKVSLKEDVLQFITLPAGSEGYSPGSITIGSTTDNTLTLANGTGIQVSGSGQTLTISAVKATKETFGVAKFNQDYFTVTTAGEVKINVATTTDAVTPMFGLSKFDAYGFTVTSGVVTANAFTIGDVDIHLGDNNDGETDHAIYDLTGLTSIEVGDLKLSGNTLEATTTNKDVILKPLGTVSGRPASIMIDDGTANKYWMLPPTRGTGTATNEVLTINKTTGQASWISPYQNLSVYSDATSPNNMKVLTVGAGSIKFHGTQGIATKATKTVDEESGQVEIEIQGQLASSSSVGVASFNTGNFNVSVAGDVTIKTDGVGLTELAIKTIGIGSTVVTLGENETNFAGIDSLAFPMLKIGGSTVDGATPSEQEKGTITAVGTNKNIYLTGTGSGKIWISGQYALPNVKGTTGQVLVAEDDNGKMKWDTPAVTIGLSDGTTTGSHDLKSEDPLVFAGGQSITTEFNDTNDTFTISAVLADDSGTIGVAGFSSEFDVVDGVASLKDGQIANEKLENSTIQFGTYALSTNEPTALGGTITTLKNMTGITTGDLRIGTTAAASTIENVTSSTNGGIIFKTKGSGDITFFDGKDYSFSLPKARSSSSGLVLTSAGDGTTSWATPVTTITINDERAGPDHKETINLNGGVLLFKDGVGTTASVGTDSITINGVIANGGTSGDTDILGVASYNTGQFSVSSGGVVTLVNEGIQDIVGPMINLTGTSLTHDNIAVAYEDQGSGAGKLTFKVPYATDSVEGVASFTTGDFTVGTVELGTAGVVSLAGTVVKGITTNGTSVTPSSNSFAIEGAGAISTAGEDEVLTISVATATASTLGVAFFPTGSTGDFIIGASGNALTEGKIKLRKATYSTSGVAKFASSHFSIDETLPTDTPPSAETGNGAVTIRGLWIGGQELYPGNTAETTYDTFTDLTSVTVGELNLASNSITATGAATNINIGLSPKGPNGTVAVSGAKITNLGNPSNASDAATKEYVDSKASGLTVKDPVRIATGPSVVGNPNANGVDSVGKVTLSYTVSTASTASYPVIDGNKLDINDRVLVKNQGPHSGEAEFADGTDDAENGIYVWKDTAGTAGWARAADADISGDFTGATFVFVQEGERWADTGWVLQTNWDPLTSDLDTDPLKFVQFSAAGVLKPASDGGLYKSGGYFGINLITDYKGLEVNADNKLILGSDVAGDGLDIAAGTGIISVSTDGTTIEIDSTSKSIKIAANYTGQDTISTVGTIGEGTWEGDTIAATYGGTGVATTNKGDLLIGNSSYGWDILARGAAGKVLQVVNNGTSGSPNYAVEYGDIDGGEY